MEKIFQRGKIGRRTLFPRAFNGLAPRFLPIRQAAPSVHHAHGTDAGNRLVHLGGFAVAGDRAHAGDLGVELLRGMDLGLVGARKTDGGASGVQAGGVERDGHRSLSGERPFFRVPIHGDDGGLRDEAVIRVTDVGFPEKTLLDQDEFLCGLLRRPEFQRRMSGTEFRFLLGRHFAEQEKKVGAPEGLLALCHRKAIPVFVGAPADGSVFLNAMLLWALRETCGDAFALELDLYEEVFESCAYHRWGLFDSEARNLGTLILGGGVPKNFNLQPEPALGQIFGFENISGFLYDIQLTTAPVSDGSLSSCPPAEAVTWGKVDKEHYRRTTASMQVDYTVVMPFLVKALLEKRARFEDLAGKLGPEALFEKHPEARGYLRPRDGYRLFERRTELMERLREKVRKESARLRRESAHRPSPARVD